MAESSHDMRQMTHSTTSVRCF